MTEVVAVVAAAERDLGGVMKAFAVVVVGYHSVVEAFLGVVAVEEGDVAGVVKPVAGVDYLSAVVAVVEAVVAVVGFGTGFAHAVGVFAAVALVALVERVSVGFD